MFERGLILGMVLLLVCAGGTLAAGKSPGVVGAYVNFGAGYSDTPEEAKALVDEAADAGIQFLLPMATTTSGMAMYDSKILPHAPGEFDRLKVLIEAAHKRGLKVHPWMEVNAQGPTMLEKHPDWCQMNSEGVRVGYLDPSSPDVRRYVASIAREIAEKYDIDGISLDYVRYSGGGRFCFCDRCKAAFKKETGLDCLEADKAKPGSALWRKWRAWRYGQINDEIAEVSRAVREARPNAQVSSYVWGAHTYRPSYQVCQDFKTWIRCGWLDWINPSGYIYDRAKFIQRAKDNREAVPAECPMLITIGVRTSHGECKDAEEVKTHIRDAFDAGAVGVVLFTLEWTKPYLQDLAPFLREIGRR